MDFQLSLKSERVGAVYPDAPLAATPDTPVSVAMHLLRTQKSAAVLVCEGEKLAGIFTERDALRLLAEKGDSSVPLSDVMTSPVVSVQSDATVLDLIRKMAEGGYRHLPVVDSKGRPTGVVGAVGVVHYLVDHFPETIYNLPPSPTGRPSEREGA